MRVCGAQGLRSPTNRMRCLCSLRIPRAVGRKCSRLPSGIFLTAVGHFEMIELQFTSVSVESGHDFVEVFEDGTLLRRYTGNTTLGSIVSQGSRLVVRFRSDGGVSAQGFEASYRPYKSCFGTTYLTAEMEGFTDGSDRNSDYGSNLDCRWLIRPGYTGIRLTFTRLDLDPPGDKLTVYDGSDTSASRNVYNEECLHRLHSPWHDHLVWRCSAVGP
uniref:Cub domain-containing protein 2 n=1 Tax=Tetraselmis sp. GSL018 TaxID=582737 RepID=A0A061QLT5_9CHLO